MARSTTDKLTIFFGSLGYLGFVPVASGTVTVAVIGIPLFWAMHQLQPLTYILITLALFAVAVWLSDRGDRILGTKDSSKLVIDEIVGYAIAVFALPFTWKIVVLSFLLERIIDIVKVPPANIIENKCPGGWGVVLDDVVAGFYTLAIMHFLFPALATS